MSSKVPSSSNTSDASSAPSNLDASNASGFRVLHSAELFKGFSTVSSHTLRTPSNEVVSREVVSRPNAVGVLALTSSREVLLLRHYRHPAFKHLLEIPAGTLDVEGEQPIEGVLRELEEETGFTASNLEFLTSFFTSPGWSTEQLSLFLARDVQRLDKPSSMVLSAEEADMELVFMPFHDAVSAVKTGKITDAKTILALLYAKVFVL